MRDQLRLVTKVCVFLAVLRKRLSSLSVNNTIIEYLFDESHFIPYLNLLASILFRYVQIFHAAFMLLIRLVNKITFKVHLSAKKFHLFSSK